MTHHCQDLPDVDIKSTLQLCSKLLSKVQPSMKVIEMKEEVMATIKNSKLNFYMNLDLSV